VNKLIEQIKFEEGLRLKAYICPAGVKTIGYGHNLEKAPYFDHNKIPDEITQDQAEAILFYDLGEKLAEMRRKWNRFDEFDPARRDAFLNMAYQLGVNGFLAFERLRSAAMSRDWETAHKQALNSRWAKQTPARAKRVAGQILTGKYYEVFR
jgi:lysozyme